MPYKLKHPKFNYQELLHKLVDFLSFLKKKIRSNLKASLLIILGLVLLAISIITTSVAIKLSHIDQRDSLGYDVHYAQSNESRIRRACGESSFIESFPPAIEEIIKEV